MLNAVVDTNVLISGIISPHGYPRKIYQAWKENKFTLIITSEIKEEILDVLNRPKIAKKYHLSAKRIKNICRALDLYTRKINSAHITVASLSDPKDLKFLSASASIKADYLVTGDKELLAIREYQATRIIKPSEFVAILEKRTDKL